MTLNALYDAVVCDATGRKRFSVPYRTAVEAEAMLADRARQSFRLHRIEVEGTVVADVGAFRTTWYTHVAGPSPLPARGVPSPEEMVKVLDEAIRYVERCVRFGDAGAGQDALDVLAAVADGFDPRDCDPSKPRQ